MRTSTLVIIAALTMCAIGARADEIYTTTITIRGHRFEPSELHVPAGKRILLTIVNADPLSEEFDSPALKVEKVIAGNAQGMVRFGPLDPGHYEFVGEYHDATAKGQVVAE